MPEISVVVPVYNVEKYLYRCIESILAQTFTDFELILVDDGSPDNCPQICDEWARKDSRIKVIHKNNGGVSVARNVGLDVAQGEYIAFCDSDDYIKSDFLMSLYENAVNTTADVVVSNYSAVTEDGEFVKVSNHKIGTLHITSIQERWNFLLNYTLSQNHGWEVWTRLFKSSIIEKHNIRFCTTCQNYAEDLGFTFEYCLYSNIISSISDNNYGYVLRGNSMMSTSVGKVKVDQLNEVSAFLYPKYEKAFDLKRYKLEYAIFHFLIIYTEFRKIIGTERYPYISEEISKVNQKDFYFSQTKTIYKCKKKLKELYGKKVCRQILLFSHYCLHGNWKLFLFESNLAYRFFIKGE